MAGLGRRVFAAGEVLTAGNVMGYLQDQAVMNFAGTAARGSAIGTAVSEGMISYLADSNVVQAYDGSAWNSLAYASSVFTPGLIPVAPSSVDKTGGTASANSLGQVTFSGVSSISLNDVFSSTYANYFILFDVTTSVDAVPNTRLRVSGTDTTSGYGAGRIYQIDGSIGGQNNGSGGSWGMTPTGVQKFEGSMTLYKPNQAANTHGHHSMFMVSSNSSITTIAQQHATQAFLSATQFTGMTFYPSTGTTSGIIQVFGYND